MIEFQADTQTIYASTGWIASYSGGLAYYPGVEGLGFTGVSVNIPNVSHDVNITQEASSSTEPPIATDDILGINVNAVNGWTVQGATITNFQRAYDVSQQTEQGLPSGYSFPGFAANVYGAPTPSSLRTDVRWSVNPVTGGYVNYVLQWTLTGPYGTRPVSSLPSIAGVPCGR